MQPGNREDSRRCSVSYLFYKLSHNRHSNVFNNLHFWKSSKYNRLSHFSNIRRQETVNSFSKCYHIFLLQLGQLWIEHTNKVCLWSCDLGGLKRISFRREDMEIISENIWLTSISRVAREYVQVTNKIIHWFSVNSRLRLLRSGSD